MSSPSYGGARLRWTGTIRNHGTRSPPKKSASRQLGPGFQPGGKLNTIGRAGASPLATSSAASARMR